MLLAMYLIYMTFCITAFRRRVLSSKHGNAGRLEPKHFRRTTEVAAPSDGQRAIRSTTEEWYGK
jgi:hypothetical protein